MHYCYCEDINILKDGIKLRKFILILLVILLVAILIDILFRVNVFKLFNMMIILLF